MFSKTLNLKLDKVGTYAHVFVNEVKVAELNNIYRTYYINLYEAQRSTGMQLHAGKNKLRIVIDSTVRRTTEEKLKYGDK